MNASRTARIVPRLLASVTLAAAACSDSTATRDAVAGQLHGSITSSKTSLGVGNLIVAIERDGAILHAVPTDGAGLFVFPAMPDGHYTVRVTGLELAPDAGHFTAIDPPSFDVDLQGAAPEELFFAAVGLVPSRIVGSVTCSGAPVAGARVRVIGGTVDRVEETNEQGRYAAIGLDPGHYAVIVESAPCGVAPMYHAAALLAAQAAELDFGG